MINLGDIGEGDSIERSRQEALTHSDLRFKTLTDMVPQLIWENEPDGTAVYFNSRWFEYSGLTFQQSYGRGWIAMAHPTQEDAVNKWKAALDAGEQFESEVMLKRHDGQYLWHLLRNIPMKSDDEHIVRWFGTATDIHRQKNTEKMLEETSGRLRAIMETASDFAVITLDKNGYIVDMNAGAEKLFGYQRIEAIGQSGDLFFTPEDRYARIHQQEMEAAVSTGRARDERWHLRKDGSRFFVSGVMTPIEHSLISGFVKIARDITDRKLAEEALFVSEQRKSLAVQSAEMGEWQYDVTNGLINGSMQACRLLGTRHNPGGCNIVSFRKYIHEDDIGIVETQLNNALQGTYIFSAEFRIRKKEENTIIWVNAYGRIISHEEELPVRMIGVIYDITNRKLLEKQKDDFINVASHELRSPVTSIKAYCELLADSFSDNDTDPNARLVQKLNVQVERLVKLIYNLLDSSTLTELNMKLVPEPLDINLLIKERMADVLFTSGRSRIRFEESQVPIIHADAERLGQVIINLLSNALKYSADDTEVLIRTEDQLDGVMVTVQDKGVGIPVEAQTQLFERYYRVRDQKILHNHGLGLGLYISAEIVKHHHGSIGVSSMPGEGSTFYFKLPYA